jgi:pimeloyl-ACP methyl ester carboxylesterase
LETIKVNNLAVYRMLAEDKKQEYPLFFIHGAGGNGGYLENYMNFFSQSGWDTYAINLRGHYPSDYEKNLGKLTIQDYVQDATSVMKTLDIENSVVIGHSMGGLIAQIVAAQIEPVKGLIAISSAPPRNVSLFLSSFSFWVLNGIASPPPLMPKLGLKRNINLFLIFLKSLKSLIASKPIQPNFPVACETILNNVEERNKKTIYNALVPESVTVALQVARGVHVDQDRIRCPRLVIAGNKDVLAVETMQRRLATHLKADYIVYNQFGHLPMIEKGWEQSAEDIRLWLRKNIQ